MTFVFPDNTVFINFAVVNRVDLLRDWTRGRGRWVEAVRYEVVRSMHMVPTLNGVTEEWLGPPIEFAHNKDLRAIERIRRVVFGGSQTEPLKHLGEAQTCHLFATRPEFAGAIWISDDVDAREQAERVGALTMTTRRLMEELVAEGAISAQQGFDLMTQLWLADRPVPRLSSPRDLL